MALLSYKKIISRFTKINILVIGDIILDRYIEGEVSRISPEAPVPIVLEKRSYFRPGGAANVAHNLNCLKVKVTQVGRIGHDFEGGILKRLLRKKGIDISGILMDKDIPTITKTRVIGQQQQIVRIDKEKKADGQKSIESRLLNYVEKNLDQFDAIIISDYGKGLITPQLINGVCSLALAKKKIITVDPKVEHFGFYRRVTSITPNLKETENAIRNIKITSTAPSTLNIHVDKLDNDHLIDLAGQELMRYLELESLLITMGEHGMRLFEKEKKPVSIATQVQEVFDVTGAGDTVISLFTLSLAAGATKRQAAEIANAAAGIVVGKRGAAGVTYDELMATPLFKPGVSRNQR
jgi:D-beta-D-heptose 7-phosphate kinase/D-beta-D-heptose 1-phosphate adenosyltransferase